MKRSLEYRGGRVLEFLADCHHEINRRFGEAVRDVLIHPNLYRRFCDELIAVQGYGDREFFDHAGKEKPLLFQDMEVYESRQVEEHVVTLFTQRRDFKPFSERYGYIRNRGEHDMVAFPMTPEECLKSINKVGLEFKKPKKTKLC